MLYLEKKRPGALLGPRYGIALETPGGIHAQERLIEFADLRLDPAGPADADGALDGRYLKSISLVDITAADGRAARKNTLWLSSIRPQ